MLINKKDAMRCVDLLDSLDFFAVKTLNLFKRQQEVNVKSDNDLRIKARSIWQKKPAFLPSYIAAYPSLSDDDRKIIFSWKKIVRDKFIVSRYCEKYAIFFSICNTKPYGVLALSDPFSIMLPSLPILIETALVPYNNQIVWDGIVLFPDFEIRRDMALAFAEEGIKAINNGTVITSL